MILYHAITTYHVLVCLVHKVKFHEDEEAEILVPNFLYDNMENLKDNKIFKKVNVFFWDSVNRNKDGYSEPDVIAVIEREMRDMWGNEIVENFVDYFSEINVCSAAYFFGFWLVNNEIHFNWFEEASGRYSYPEVIMEQDRQVFPLRYRLACQNNMYTGNNKYVNQKYVNLKAQKEEVDYNSLIDFDIVQELNGFDEKKTQKIREFFNYYRDNKVDTEECLLLTQHFSNLKLLTYDEHVLCYQLTVDYYFPDKKICCKKHPSDNMPYEMFLNLDSKIVERFPSELLAIGCSNKYSIIASINSTAVYSLEKLAERVLTFNDEYLSTFKDNHKYFFLLECVKKCGFQQVEYIGINELQLQNLMNMNWSKNSRIDNNTRLFVFGKKDCDRFQKIDFDKRNTIIFLQDEVDDGFFFEISGYKRLIKRIQLSSQKSVQYEYVYILTNDIEIERIIRNMRYQKKLINSGLNVDVMNNDDEIWDKIYFEGMIKAMENKIDELILENKELRERIGKYENE